MLGRKKAAVERGSANTRFGQNLRHSWRIQPRLRRLNRTPVCWLPNRNFIVAMKLVFGIAPQDKILPKDKSPKGGESRFMKPSQGSRVRDAGKNRKLFRVQSLVEPPLLGDLIKIQMKQLFVARHRSGFG